MRVYLCMELYLFLVQEQKMQHKSQIEIINKQYILIEYNDNCSKNLENLSQFSSIEPNNTITGSVLIKF